MTTLPVEPLIFLGYSDVRTYLEGKLAHYGYGVRDVETGELPDGALYDMPTFSGQPSGDPQSWKVVPGSIVFLAVGGGPGLTKEELFDRVFISVRCVGEQSDHEGGRRLAMAVDRALLAFDSSDYLGTIYTLYVGRAGGSPQLLMRDDGERYHYPTSYIAEAETGL